MKRLISDHCLLILAMGSTLVMLGCERPAPDETSSEADAAPRVQIDLITVGGEGRFEQDEIRVPAGTTVWLTLANSDDSDAYNWVLTELNRADEVAVAGAEAGAEADYFVEHSAVIAYTPMVPPGGVGEVIFLAPPPGTYSFVSTFPGHFMTSQGRFIVE